MFAIFATRKQKGAKKCGLFSLGHTAVKLSGAEATDRTQCAAPD